ncbi:hypothetical protein EW146_g5705 [Bondarzewia mesenterica]|uniref:BTB domain-containing protein n=1 Tax=Bondarzewia mesenterica TaxID=1095465 RepID=A0A4S4LRA5_9AGAM|nr:hypothetical protein EW146_g5705 [Bondarzewia mesenterica]
MTPLPPIRNAGPPFDAADADIVLRTNDLVDFRVHTSILSISSQVFKDMSSMPLPPNSEPADNSDRKDGLPIVFVTEDEHSIHLLLKVLYPRGMQPVSNPSDIKSLLKLLDKYQVDGHPLLSALSSAAQIEPVMVYVLACRHNLPYVANAAAEEMLKMSLTSVVTGLAADQDLRRITGYSCVRLLKYHLDCCEAAITVCQSLRWIATSKIPGASEITARTGQIPCACLIRHSTSSKLNEHTHVPGWVVDYVGRCEAIIRTTPHWDTVMDFKLFIPSIIAAGKCSRCMPLADKLPDFAKAFANQLKSVISKVRLRVRHETLQRDQTCIRPTTDPSSI